MVRFMWRYPVFHVPLVFDSASLRMTYYNVGARGAVVWILSLVADGFSDGTSVSTQHFGDPTWRIPSTICAIYVMAMGMCVFHWMSWRWVVRIGSEVLSGIRFTPIWCISYATCDCFAQINYNSCDCLRVSDCYAAVGGIDSIRYGERRPQ